MIILLVSFVSLLITAYFITILFSIGDESDDSKKDTDKIQYEKHYCILVLLAEVIKADREIKDCELDKIKEYILCAYKTEKEQTEALKQFQANLENKHYINDVCNQINMLLNATSKTEIVMELMAVAYADGIFNETEVSVINSIINDLNLSSYKKSIYAIFMRKYNQSFYRSQSSSNQEYKKEKDDNSNNESNYKKASDNNYSDKSLDESFDILGIPHNVSDEEIKKAYRALAKEYHPDKFSALGDEAIRQATETMKQINMAWETLKSTRQIK